MTYTQERALGGALQMSGGVTGYAAVCVRLRVKCSNPISPSDMRQLADAPELTTFSEALRKTPFESLASDIHEGWAPTAALRKARLTLGSNRVEWAALVALKTVEVNMKCRGTMGVAFPVIEAVGSPHELLYCPADTNAALDEPSAAFREVLLSKPQLYHVGNRDVAAGTRAAKEARWANTLQHILLPNNEVTVAFIESALEEREREEIYRLKNGSRPR